MQLYVTSWVGFIAGWEYLTHSQSNSPPHSYHTSYPKKLSLFPIKCGADFKKNRTICKRQPVKGRKRCEEHKGMTDDDYWIQVYISISRYTPWLLMSQLCVLIPQYIKLTTYLNFFYLSMIAFMYYLSSIFFDMVYLLRRASKLPSLPVIPICRANIQSSIIPQPFLLGKG